MSGTGEQHRSLGRLFVRRRTRWPHLFARTLWSGNTRGLKPEPTPPQTQHCAPFACDGAHVVPQRCVQAGRAVPCPCTPSILPLGVSRLGVGVGAAREAPGVGALAMVEPMPASRNGRPGPGRTWPPPTASADEPQAWCGKRNVCTFCLFESLRSKKVRRNYF